MIRYTSGDILEAGTEALVNTVNTVGVMGRGIALQFKEAFPANYKAYAAACKRGEVEPGRMFVFDLGELTLPRYIINFPTKRHWRGKSRIEDIRSGLVALVNEIRDRGIHSVAIPPLGSGLGGLDWNDVRPLIADAFSGIADVDVLIFEPSPRSADAPINRSTNVPQMTAGRAALVGLMHRYLGALLDPSISLLEVHKLMYFLQAAGEPLKLRYAKAKYGPFAENLGHVLRAVDGHLVAGYSANNGDDPTQQLALVPGAVKDAASFLETKTATRERFNRVVQLVEGFETPYGLELLATVHWVAVEEGAVDAHAIEAGTHNWIARKKQFTSAQIRLATDRLREEGWLGAAVEVGV
ncbi:MAG: macro domain-containing protein [Gemmatimonadaceae bacterium]